MTKRISALDRRVMVLIAARRTPVRTFFMRAATHSGDKVTMLIVGLLLVAIGYPRLGIAIGLGSGGGGVSAQIVKRAFRRRRPSVGMEKFEAIGGNPDNFSFPSGHTASAFGAAFALFGQAGVMGWAFLAIAPMVGFSRIYLGVHYPSDVIVGAALGTLMGVIANVVLF